VLRLTDGVEVKKDRNESVALRVSALIDAQEYLLADSLLVDLEKAVRRGQRDVCNGLRCKLLLRQYKWREAETYWRRIDKKDNDIHKALRVGILTRILEDSESSLAERQRAQEELKKDFTGMDTISLPTKVLSDLDLPDVD